MFFQNAFFATLIAKKIASPRAPIMAAAKEVNN
jgi:hypothetical protein